jgi:hypothetical protein
MLAKLIHKSRKDAHSQGLQQMILVERHLCEREIAETAARNVNDLLRYLVPGVLEAYNLRAVETSKTMVAWEADDCETPFFPDGPASIKFATNFEGRVVRITAPIYFKETQQ